jgi:hypothetical protein
MRKTPVCELWATLHHGGQAETQPKNGSNDMLARDIPHPSRGDAFSGAERQMLNGAILGDKSGRSQERRRQKTAAAPAAPTIG